MAAAERLYTPELLGLAVELASWPPLMEPSYSGEARSPTCGSTIRLDLLVDDHGCIDGIGMRVMACAIGQAAAALFARSAVGHDRNSIAGTVNGLELWLAGTGPLPEWPGLAAIASARDYPSRHGALLLPWKAALAALSTAPPAV